MLETIRMWAADILRPRSSSGSGERTVQAKEPAGFAQIMPSGSRLTTPVLGTAELLFGYSYYPWLRAVVDKISEGIGETEWTLSVSDNPINDNALLDLLAHPNPDMDGDAFFKLAGKHLCLVGELFWLIERNGAGTPIELWPIPAHWVKSTPLSSDENGQFEVQYRSWHEWFPRSEMIYIRDPDPANPWGRSSAPAKALGDELESDEFAAKHIKTFFLNRARPDLLIFSEDPENPIKKAAAKRLEQSWLQRLQSWRNAHRPFFLPGKVGVKDISSSFKDMTLVELRKELRNSVLQVYGLPPESLGILENSNRATIEAAEIFLTKHVIVPKVKLIRSGMQGQLVPQFDQRLDLGFVNPVAEDKEFILKATNQHAYAFEINELRDLAGRGPLERGGDKHPVPFNIMFEDAPGSSDPEPVERSFSAKAIDNSDIEDIVDVIGAEEFAPELTQANEDAVLAFGQSVVDEVAVGIAFNIESPRVVDFLREQSVDRVVGLTNETTKRQLREALADGISEGEGAAQLSKRITAVFNEAKGSRSFKIARTESVRATNFGALEGMKQVNIPQKQWITVGDANVRDEHVGLHQQIRDTNNAFLSPGGFQAQYPGGFGIAEMDIECRCSIITVLPEESAAITDQRAKNFDRRRQPFERLLRRSYVRGFDEQRKLVLEALREADRTA